MNKNILKTLFASFIVLFSALFINIDDAEADQINQTVSIGCKCYYQGTSYNGDTKTLYDVVMSYGPNHATVVSMCQNSDVQSAAGITNCGKINNARRGNPFEVDSKYIYDNNCSVQACNSANIYFYSSAASSNTTLGQVSHEVVTSGFGCFANACVSAQLTAYSKEAHETIVNATSMNDASKDLGIQQIKNWGDISAEGEYNLEDVGTTCSSIGETAELLSEILWIVDIIAIVILIIMTAVDFVRAIIGSEEDTLKSAFKHLITRIIVVFILLLLPIILGAIIKIINAEEGTVKIGVDDNGNTNIFCDIGN